MPISEIGLLKLKPSYTIKDPELQTRLTEVQNGLHEFTYHKFYFFEQVEDPSFIYLLGHSWKERVKVMSKYFEFQWMAHYDFLIEDLNLDLDLDIGQGVLEVMRFSMGEDEKESFADKVTKVRSGFDGATDAKVLNGWKVDVNRDKEEYVELVAWRDLRAREEFVNVKGYDLEILKGYAEFVDAQFIKRVL
ncbi:hypothetical protein N7478_011717 [Penicillium angulare]|uniref:uncharacterized protein n=1 Tax=Penicillium angulare TaxID=116970 RepID=UPI00253F9CBC|nr:uncharacterized protein N7478_011717 [Penicillium angulare]KAJ5261122.1 hypothetical protein N7478_011717 [Penicillium angulare]